MGEFFIMSVIMLLGVADCFVEFMTVSLIKLILVSMNVFEI